MHQKWPRMFIIYSDLDLEIKGQDIWQNAWLKKYRGHIADRFLTDIPQSTSRHDDLYDNQEK